MFSRFYNLKMNPFGETPNTKFFFRANAHMNALNQIFQSFQSGKGMTLVVGEVGTGKTLLCRLFAKLIEESARTALIFQPIFQELDLFRQIADEYGLPSASAPTSAKDTLDQLTSFFIHNASRGQRNVILIDEAHKLSHEALEALRMLTNLESEYAKIVQVVLFAQPEIESKLQTFPLRQVKQRISGMIHLAGLTEAETGQYVTHRIEQAGGHNFVRFDKGAIEVLFRESRGIPRLLNFYAETVLASAQSAQMRHIDRALASRALNVSAGGGFFEALARILETKKQGIR